MDLEQAIISAVKECQRQYVKPTAAAVHLRLPETYQYYHYKYIESVMRRMAGDGKLKKSAGRKGYLALPTCPCCGQAILHPFSFAS